MLLPNHHAESLQCVGVLQNSNAIFLQPRGVEFNAAVMVVKYEGSVLSAVLLNDFGKLAVKRFQEKSRLTLMSTRMMKL
jgi:hypothetical protein